MNRLDGQINGLRRQGACERGNFERPFKVQTVCAGRGRVNLWTRISASVRGKHAHAQAELMQGVSVPECVRPIPTRILSEAKKSLFLDVIESCYELDFTRKQTAKNGGFVCREFLNPRGVLLNFWTIQRVKHMRIVSNACGSRLIVKL